MKEEIMAKIEVEGDKAHVQLYDNVTGPMSELDLTRDQIVNSAINHISGMSEQNDREKSQTNRILDTYLEVLDKMNKENNG